mgnify:CR=1 FL=1|tara:strand:+ start:508 stop:756 length:249 start_codon:yes stop_codon:yes gene_type:complete
MVQIKNQIRKLDKLSDLNDLTSFINDCKTMLGKSALSVGSNVLVVQKTKKTPGVITKMMVKKALVDMRGRIYRVPFAMLELA